MARGLRIGLIGAGYIARSHVYGYRAMPTVFPDAAAMPVLELACDAGDDLARRAARRFGFARSTGDWRRVVEDPEIDVVDICVPSHLHRPIALAAVAAGKHVFCEKPVGLHGGEAREIAAAAARASVRSLVGYTYLRHPLVAFARTLIAEGRIGRIVHFRGRHNEDYMASPDLPHAWRCDRAIAGEAGALGDLGGHIVAIARHLVGEIEAVCGDTRTVIAERPAADGSGRLVPVGNEDQAQLLVRFAGGASGHIECSRVASGRKLDIAFEVTGTHGAIAFCGERMGEIEVYQAEGPAAERGFRTVLCGPDHPPYGNFVPAPGHGLGFNDLVVIEVHELMQAVAAGADTMTDLDQAWRISRIVDAVLASARSGGWMRPSDLA